MPIIACKIIIAIALVGLIVITSTRDTKHRYYAGGTYLTQNN